jgi:hypothetical protein
MRDPPHGIREFRAQQVGECLTSRSGALARWAALGAACATTGLAPLATAAEPPPVPALTDSAAEEIAPAADEQAVEEPATGATPQVSPLVVTGYVDVGFAKAQGDGTSYPSGYVPGMPNAVDYYVDTFAPAVNSRGEVASTVPPPNTMVNGFLPRSAGIGGKGSFLLNTADVDLRYTATEIPVLVFTRLQLVPRLYGPDATPGQAFGDNTRLVLEQAFGRIAPLRDAELAINVGKFDSVFGIEYLDNQANFRIGVTPSLIARYTTGQSVGVKAFYRLQIIPASSAVSLNVAATNSGTFVESLQGPSRSLTGVPVVSMRLGYELNLERISLKVGGSAAYGPRNDQTDSSGDKQTLLGFDARLVVPTLTVSGEFVHVDENDAGISAKVTGTGVFPFVTEFYAHGFYVQAAEELPLKIAPFRIIVYARYDRRTAEFEGIAKITIDRVTAGVNVGIGDNLVVKGEYLVNREVAGAPQVANNVATSSVVWTW